MKLHDEEIREHFADLSAEDRSRAPQFSALWTEAERRAVVLDHRKQTTRRWWFAAAASVVVAAGLLVQRGQRHDDAAQGAVPDSLNYPSITSWSAPTDGLLRVARGAVPASPSVFGSSLDGVTGHSVPSNSNK